MAISGVFADRLSPYSVTISYESGASGYSSFEWSYAKSTASNYLVRGGTDLACQHGASALLEALGFRFYAPDDSYWWKLPAGPLNMDLVATKQKFLMPDNVLSMAYGHGSYLFLATVRANLARWLTLTGMDQEYYLAGHRWQSICADSAINGSGFWSSRPGVRVDRNKSANPDSGATFTADGAAPTGSAPIITFNAFNTTAYSGGSEARKFRLVTDGDDGAVVVVATTTNNEPSSAQVLLGQNHLGATVPSRTLAITASGTYDLYSIAGLAGNTTYYFWAVHRNAALQASAVASGGSAKTSAYSYTFNIQVAIDNGWYDDLVNVCAAWLLTAGFNSFNTTEFDASDSDTQSSDIVFPFTKAVGEGCRAGTAAIGPYGALSGNPNAQLGIYAYAGHRLPPFDNDPDYTVAPSVFTQVALGFNRTRYKYVQLIERHARKSATIKTREYLGTQLWDRAQPMRNGRARRNYFNVYTDPNPDVGYIAAAARAGKELIGSHIEFSGTWIVNIIMMRWGILTLRGVTTTYEAVLAEIVADIFGGDPKVTELYTLWGDPFKRWHGVTLQESMEIVEGMQSGWYKTYFKKYLVFCYEWLTLPPQIPLDKQTPEDPFPAAFAKMMAHATALGTSDFMHSWGTIRAEANQNVATNYPALKYDTVPAPSWLTASYEPTDADFNAALAALQIENARFPELTGTDFVTVKGITPVASSYTKVNATEFYVRSFSEYWVIGPSVLSASQSDVTTEDGELIEGGVEEFIVPAGRWKVQVEGTATITWQGGEVYLIAYPFAEKWNVTGGDSTSHWIYIQQSAEDLVDIEPMSRTSIWDQNGRTDIYWPFDDGYAGPYTDIGPGQCRLDYTNTQGLKLNNVNPHVSPYWNANLLPRAMADADFPRRSAILIGS